MVYYRNMMEKKIVINKCFGGFGLADWAFEEWANRSGYKFVKELDTEFKKRYNFEQYDVYVITDEDEEISSGGIDREDSVLIEMIEEFGSDDVSGNYSELKIVSIPADVEYNIHEYDGLESVHEKHRVWS